MATRLYIQTTHERKLLVYAVTQHDWDTYLTWKDMMDSERSMQKEQELYESASDTTHLINHMEVFGFGRVKSSLIEDCAGGESDHRRIETILRDQAEGASAEQRRIIYRAMGLVRSNKLTVYWC